jgi:hypothetical protein
LALAVAVWPAGARPQAAAVTGCGDALHDQYDHPGASAISSAFDVSYLDAFDAELADDFVVPDSPFDWVVECVSVAGRYVGGPGPAASFDVRFYDAAAGGVPGPLIAVRMAQSYSGSGGNAVIARTNTVYLAGYEEADRWVWVSVQARMDAAGNGGQWGWTVRTVRWYEGAAFRNPGVCTAWTRRTVCIPTEPSPDQVFRLTGHVEPDLARAGPVYASKRASSSSAIE